MCYLCRQAILLPKSSVYTGTTLSLVVFSAEGAASIKAWGIAPRPKICNRRALKARFNVSYVSGGAVTREG